MHYLLTPEEFKRLRGFDDAEKWEREVRIWYRNFMKYFGQMVIENSHRIRDLSILEIEEEYTSRNPYPKLEDYLQINEPGFEENKGTD